MPAGKVISTGKRQTRLSSNVLSANINDQSNSKSSTQERSKT